MSFRLRFVGEDFTARWTSLLNPIFRIPAFIVAVFSRLNFDSLLPKGDSPTFVNRF
jgi:hypothetical protein